MPKRNNDPGRPAAGKPKSKPAAAKPKKITKPVKKPEANVSMRYPKGRTLKTQDKYLPESKGGKPDKPKASRRAVVIDSNRKDELAVVKLTTSKQPNTSPLPSYKQGNGKPTQFKHFVETQDNEGNPIKVDGKKFKENPWAYDLSASEVNHVRKVVLEETRQSKTNKEKIAALKKNGDKKGKKKR